VSSDLYALGVMLYEMLAGRLPYEAADRASYVRLQMTRDAEPVSFHVEDLPAGTDELVSRCLARTPPERPGTAAEVEETLERLAKRAGLARPARPAQGGAAGSPRPPAAADARDPSHDPSRERERAEAASAPGAVKGRGGTARPRTGTVLETPAAADARNPSRERERAEAPVPRAGTPVPRPSPSLASGPIPIRRSALPGGVWAWVVTGMVVAATVGGLAVHWGSPTPGRVEMAGVGPPGPTTSVAAGTAVGAATEGPTPTVTSVFIGDPPVPPPGPTAPTTGSVIVESVPSGASVVDQATGRELGFTPYRRSSVPAGTWDFTLVLPGHRDKPMTAKVEPGRPKRVKATLEPVMPTASPDPSRSPDDPGRTQQRAVSTHSDPATQWKNEKDGSVMVRIAGGTFQMGSTDGRDDEKPVHSVTLSAYSIGKHEVTNEQFERFVTAEGYRTTAETKGSGWMLGSSGAWEEVKGADWRHPRGPGSQHWGRDHPVVLVSWDDAKAYCEWAGLRLPTEAEWEYAARGADGRKYPWGEQAPDEGGVYRANWGEGGDHEVWKRDGYQYTAPVSAFPNGVSPFGCLNMAGNVWEWCEDRYGSYPWGPVTDPVGPTDGSSRVLRGGSWSGVAVIVRPANRSNGGPDRRDAIFGFRPARSLP
ncbi:MAG: SUMF1/EgtB/PvdO family nonheme iron enzyme, partial [Acidobacteria bacterium]|nr:SUMF1/EgtB/PvdO family nonheme iron enzyme [Acidobacteriota bacterium]